MVGVAVKDVQHQDILIKARAHLPNVNSFGHRYSSVDN